MPNGEITNDAERSLRARHSEAWNDRDFELLDAALAEERRAGAEDERERFRVKAQAMFERADVRFDKWPADKPDMTDPEVRWQAIAFSLYTLGILDDKER